jgi:large subunit ribosomal protein L3
MNVLYAKKHHQQHVYDTNGKRLLVTVLTAESMPVTQVKTTEKDGYEAVQVALGSKKRLNKPLAGHIKASNLKPAVLREIRLDEPSSKQVGETVTAAEVVSVGDAVSVHAQSTGKGFAGVVKRWGFAGGPKTHGQSDRHRSPGSIGQGTTPGRVWKGKKMGGHMGAEQICVTGGQVVHLDVDAGEIWITGTVPGKKGGIVTIKKVKDGEFIGLHASSQPETKSQKDTEVTTTETNSTDQGDKQDTKESSEQENIDTQKQEDSTAKEEKKKD